MAIEAILKEINAVLGVTGSFICTNEGSIAAQAMPAKHSTEHVEVAARVITQTFQALEMSGQRVADTDFLYGDGRLIVRNLENGTLVILCSRNINWPLLNLATTNAIKKLDTEFKPAKPVAAALPVRTEPAPAPPPLIEPLPVSAGEIMPNPLFVELEKEAVRLIGVAQSNQVRMIVMDPIALWHCCTQTRRWLAQPQKRQIDFVVPVEQSVPVARLFERVGYRPNQRFNTLHGRRRLYFQDPQRVLSANVFLDAFEMYHRLNLRADLTRGETILSETPLALMRLQMVEITEADLGDLCALFIDHDLSPHSEEGKIDTQQISRLCAEDWGWYRTVMTNLDILSDFAESQLPPVDQEKVVRRVRYLKSNIEATPKNLRWLTRARLGETVRWYDTPISVSALGA